jgi:hypothetical protein
MRGGKGDPFFLNYHIVNAVHVRTDIDDDRVRKRTASKTGACSSWGKRERREAECLFAKHGHSDFDIFLRLRLKHDLRADGEDALVVAVSIEYLFVS